MITEKGESIEEIGDNFAEKCRKALEHSYGCQIPVPKHLQKGKDKNH
jgi:hypothetical protein